jgi:hypothetical protein
MIPGGQALGWAPRDRSCARRERGDRLGFRADARGGSRCRRSNARSGPFPLPLRGGAGRLGEGAAFGVPQRGTACVNMKLKRLTGERPSTVLAWRRVAEGNCVAVRRGGEQPKANLSSQSSQTRRLNPIRLVGVASLRAKGEALALSLPEAITKHDHTIAKDSDGVWDEKAGKAEQLSVEILLGATESGEEVRALIVALKRVTTVEPRGAGR